MKNKKQEFDVAVVGGGPAGMMAAIRAAELGAKTVLIEKNGGLGEKLLLTGNGRCNLTNAEFDLKKLVSHYNKNGSFLFHAFSVFGPKETIGFFKKIGIETKTEGKQRVFPASNSAADVLEAMSGELKKKKAAVLCNKEVKDVVFEKGSIEKIVLAEGKITARNYIFCTGGKSYPLTGSSGEVFQLIEKAGHKINALEPALVPIKIKEGWIKELQGLGLENVGISVWQFGKKIKTVIGDCLFAHFGLSGPAVIDLSRTVGDLLKNGEVKIFIDLNPFLSQGQIEEKIKNNFKDYHNKSLKNCLADFPPRKMVLAIARLSSIDPEKKVNGLTKEERGRLFLLLKKIELTAESLLGFDLAMATSGGVLTKEIDGKTMRSRIISNLFFAGEIIDIDGATGGFNLQNCWSTGYLAGQSAAENK
jgi:hypothetical protein